MNGSLDMAVSAREKYSQSREVGAYGLQLTLDGQAYRIYGNQICGQLGAVNDFTKIYSYFRNENRNENVVWTPPKSVRNLADSADIGLSRSESTCRVASSCLSSGTSTIMEMNSCD